MKTTQLLLAVVTVIAAPLSGQELERARHIEMIRMVREAPFDEGIAAQVAAVVLESANGYLQGEELERSSAEWVALWQGGQAILEGGIAAPPATVEVVINAYATRGVAEPVDTHLPSILRAAAVDGIDGAVEALYRIHDARMEALANGVDVEAHKSNTIPLALAGVPGDEAVPYLALIASVQAEEGVFRDETLRDNVRGILANRQVLDALYAIQGLSRSGAGRARLLELDRAGMLNKDAAQSIVHHIHARINSEVCTNVPELSACVLSEELRYYLGHQDVNANLVACSKDPDPDACQGEYQRLFSACVVGQSVDVACADSVTVQFTRGGRMRRPGT